MAGTSELKAARHAADEIAHRGASATQSATQTEPATAALAALAQVVGADPKKLAELWSECGARVTAVGAQLEASDRSRMLPLVTETGRCLGALAPSPGENARAAVAEALKLLAAAFTSGTPPPRAREMIAIAELRSVRGAPPPWRDSIVAAGVAFPAVAGAEATVNAEPLHPALLSRTLGAYRKSLLRFLKADSSEEARPLSELCNRVAKTCGAPGERRRWRAAAALFACASKAPAAPRPLVKRLAVKLEQALKHLTENDPGNAQSRDALTVDLEVLTTLLRQDAGIALDEVSGLPLKADPAALAAVLERLGETPQDTGAQLARIADFFLVGGSYDHWLEAYRLAESPVHAQALREAVRRWKTVAPARSEAGPESNVSAHFVEARAALSRIEGALQSPGGSGNGPDRVSGVPVDEALLDDLNLMAREIRGARSRAEANLGSLKGGLVDMERTIRALRTQLESLEVESHARAGGPPESGPEVGVQPTFGALSRGIEELAGLKDALEALTEKTESALAAQADEDTQLEQGLLKTRMMPVGAQFEALCQRVRRAALDSGLSATLSARGAEVVLERSQFDALVRALEPMLEACVREGMSASAVPARTDPGDGRLELYVSQPRFDVRVDIAYRGAPLSHATLAGLAPALNALGAVVACSVNADGRARVEVSIPGPPQPMDLLLVEVGESRFALPLEDISGVARPPKGAAGPEGDGAPLQVEEKAYRLTSLAELLELENADVNGSACVLVDRGEAHLAFRVDAVVGRECMLVRSPGPLLASNPWVLGVVVDLLAAPTLVLDLGGLENHPASSPA